MWHCHTETILRALPKEKESNSKSVLAVYGLKAKHVSDKTPLSLHNKLYLQVRVYLSIKGNSLVRC